MNFKKFFKNNWDLLLLVIFSLVSLVLMLSIKGYGGIGVIVIAFPLCLVFTIIASVRQVVNKKLSYWRLVVIVPFLLFFIFSIIKNPSIIFSFFVGGQ